MPIKNIRFAGHPLHPALTHFPIALWIVSFLCDLLAIAGDSTLWWTLSYWNIAIGLCFAMAAIVSGFIEYANLPSNNAILRIANRHMIASAGATTLFVASLVARSTPEPMELERMSTIIALASSICGVICLIAGGWTGAELVFRYGIGRCDNQ